MISAQQKLDTREEEMVKEIRTHLSFIATNASKIPKEQTDLYKKDWLVSIKEMIGRLRYYCTHKHWEEGYGPPNVPIGHIYQMVCRKNGGAGKLCGELAGPRISGYVRADRQKIMMLHAGLQRAIDYTPPIELQPQWLLPNNDPKNDHPGAILQRELAQKEKDDLAREKNAAQMAKARKKQKLAQDARERGKKKTKTRKERKKHFEEQDRQRSGK